MLQQRPLIPSPPGRDGVTALTIYLVCLVGVPAKLIIGSLGGIGAPAVLISLACSGWWLWFQLSRTRPDTLSQPVRAAAAVFLGCVGCSYVVAMVRPIDSPEYSTAQLGLIAVIGSCGVLLVANDGIPDHERFLTILRRVACAGGFLATLGVLQFVTGEQLIDRISLPGLSANGTLSGLASRNGFSRPAGTAVHPIEYGAVLTMILPIAVALALSDRTRSSLRRWYPVALIALAIPLSISRSAIVAAVIGLVVLGWSWTPAARRNAVLAVAATIFVLFMTVPGIVGNLTALFTTVGEDSSAASRTGSYAIAWEFIRRSPVFGRGYSTFLPSYRILDNQLLGLLIEVGVVGLVAFLLLAALAAVSAVRSRVHSDDPLVRAYGQGLAASVCSALCSLALFDGLGFPMSSGMTFLVLGLCGAAWRLSREAESPAGGDTLQRRVGRRPFSTGAEAIASTTSSRTPKDR